jgi:hypothetical protein
MQQAALMPRQNPRNQHQDPLNLHQDRPRIPARNDRDTQTVAPLPAADTAAAVGVTEAVVTEAVVTEADIAAAVAVDEAVLSLEEKYVNSVRRISLLTIKTRIC